ncbi:MAG TPA: hypothetical protein VHF22_03420, partial [Planctomycetota bacterium]|nr:hypothetical protein [Planctomycetota bacterium]
REPRMRVNAFVLAAVLTVAAGAAAAPRALAQAAAGNRLDAIRDEVKRLEADGAYEGALKLLRAVVEDTLDLAGRLERNQRIAALEAKQAERYAADRKKAAELEAAGKFPEAVAALDKVPAYGAKKQVDEAAAEQTRLKAAGEKAAAAAKVKAEEDKKKRAVEQVEDRKKLEKTLHAWIESRKNILCSKCNGAGHFSCSTCSGAGKVHNPINGNWYDCPKCKATGQVKCGGDACGGTGYARYKLEAVVWNVWPKTFRDKIEELVASKKNFLDQFLAHAGGLKPANEPPVIAAVYDVMKEGWLTAPKSHESVTIDFEDDGSAKATYLLRVFQADHRETTTWVKSSDGTWGLQPPALPGDAGGGAAAKAPPPKSRAGR